MKQYQLNDTVDFRIGEEVLQYRVTSTHLSIVATQSNSVIFDRLGIHDKYRFCSKYYGYGTREGDFPTYRSGDMKAATEIIQALNIECERFNLGRDVIYTALDKKDADVVDLIVTRDIIKSKLAVSGSMPDVIKKGTKTWTTREHWDAPGRYVHPEKNRWIANIPREYFKVVESSKKSKAPDTMLDIQAECRRRFPIGCTFIAIGHREPYVLRSDDQVYRIVNNMIYAHLHAGCLYKDGEWAKLVSLPPPVGLTPTEPSSQVISCEEPVKPSPVSTRSFPVRMKRLTPSVRINR